MSLKQKIAEYLEFAYVEGFELTDEWRKKICQSHAEEIIKIIKKELVENKN